MSKTPYTTSLLDFIPSPSTPTAQEKDDNNSPVTEKRNKLMGKVTKKKKEKKTPLMKIGSVADFFNLNTSVLRFWEDEFEELRPMRTEKGQRLYSPQDIAMVKKIKKLLHDDGLTIEGAKKVLKKSPTQKASSITLFPKNQIPSLSLSENSQENKNNDIVEKPIVKREQKTPSVQILKEIEKKLLEIQKKLV